MEAGCDFVCCDNPTANKLTIHILSAVAEDEARRISQRTKDALAAAKRRGTKLGSARPGHWDGLESKRRKGSRVGLPKAVAAASEARRQRATDAYGFLLPSLQAWRSEGLSLQAIADRLNQQGQVTSTGGPFSATAVYRAMQR